MRRQLALARRLMPILVRQQLRRQAVGAAAGGAGVGGWAGRGRSSSERLREEANAVAAAAIDDLDAHVDLLVSDVFASFGASERISFEEWRARGTRPPRTITHRSGAAASIHRLSGIDGVLGLL